LPDDLPVPKDNGACRHLTGMAVPEVTLMATSGQRVSLPDLASKQTVK
jgi:peroxiredoxin